MENTLRPWQRWLLFCAAMALVFVSGVAISALLEHQTETTNTVTGKKKIKITGIEARSSVFSENYPREYQTWADTLTVGYQGNCTEGTAVDVLAQRPELVILWAGYAFSKDYRTPQGHMFALNDITHSLRTGAPMSDTEGPQPASCWVCKSPDAPPIDGEHRGGFFLP